MIRQIHSRHRKIHPINKNDKQTKQFQQRDVRILKTNTLLYNKQLKICVKELTRIKYIVQTVQSTKYSKYCTVRQILIHRGNALY